jgi:hypothetical protein
MEKLFQESSLYNSFCPMSGIGGSHEIEIARTSVVCHCGSYAVCGRHIGGANCKRLVDSARQVFAVGAAT